MVAFKHKLAGPSSKVASIATVVKTRNARNAGPTLNSMIFRLTVVPQVAYHILGRTTGGHFQWAG